MGSVSDSMSNSPISSEIVPLLSNRPSTVNFLVCFFDPLKVECRRRHRGPSCNWTRKEKITQISEESLSFCPLQLPEIYVNLQLALVAL